MRNRIMVILVLTVALATAATFFASRTYFERLGHQNASNRVVLYLRALNEALQQHQHLPFVLARDQRYATAQDMDALNALLRSFATEAKLEAIYVMDADGLVVATSNAEDPHSFLGENYGFRPYFKQALAGARSDYFAIGATSGRPGYFVAERLQMGPDTPGVIAIKLDISELQRSWESSSETVLAVNQQDIVVLASNPDWLYRPLAALPDNIRQQVLASRQFGSEPLTALDWTPIGAQRIELDGVRYLLASGDADWRDWTVHYLQPEWGIVRQALLSTALFGSLITLLIGFATFLRSRRIEMAYAESERQRGALIETNQQLEDAQAELARTAQLAALGQLAASVTHELGQPISAFRNHLAAAEMGNEITSPDTAANLNKLVARMEAITGQFRTFARARGEQKTRLSLSTVLSEVDTMLRPDIAASGVRFERSACAPDIYLDGNQIQLEQAFINLVRNAVQAVEDSAAPMVRLQVAETPTSVDISVSDNGPGLHGASLPELQTPFFSTKPSGVGMGLGLAIATEIIRDHGGELTLADTDVGASFVVTLPRAGRST